MTSDDVNSSCRFLSPSNFPWHDEIQYGRARDFIKLGFGPRCLAYGVCWIDQFDLPLLTSVNYVTIKSSFALSATGSVALLVNIAVVLFIIFNKSLRNDLAVRLLLNVAVCDVLIALVGVLCSRFNFSEMYMKTLLDRVQGNNNGKRAFENKRRKLANIMGPILTCAVASHVLGSGISMLDKFLKIVFAMKPDVRLGRKTAVVLLVVSWSLSVTFAVLPIFQIGGMTYTDLSTPLPTDWTDDRTKQRIGFAFGSQIALVIFQLASFLLYVPIFIVAKQSGTNVGVKRESVIASEIALLLCTNLIFFTIPVVVGVSQLAILVEVDFSSVIADWRSRALAEVQWTFFLFETFQFYVWASILSSILSSTPWDTQNSSSNSIRYSPAVGPPRGSVSEICGRISGATQPSRSRLTTRWKCRRGEFPRLHLSPKEGTTKCKFNQFIPSAPLTPVN